MTSSSGSSPQTGPLGKEKTEVKKSKPISVRACDACRRRKTRCSNTTEDGSETCNWCRNAGKCCTYEPAKRGPPTTYVESLESRMEAMEELLRSLSATSGVDLVAALVEQEGGDQFSGTPAFDKVAAMLSKTTAAQLAPSAARSAPTIPPLEDEQWKDENVDKLRYFGRSSGPSFAQGLVSAYAQEPPMQMDMSTSLVEDLLEQEYHARGKQCPFPPDDLTRTLIDAYFKHFNETYRLLHQPSFERALSAGMADSNPSFRSLVLMILAIGASWVEDSRLSHSGFPAHTSGCRGFKFYSASLGRPIPSSVIIPSTLFDIQASVLGVIWLLGATTPVATWSASGFALRKAIDVGAHREARSRWKSSVLEDQLRKRAFWLLYILDRHVSVGLGRPVAMSDDDTDLAYPLDIDDTILDEWNLRGMKSPAPLLANSSVAVIEWTARLEKIIGNILARLYGKLKPNTCVEAMSVVKELDSSLNAWLTSVPHHLRWDPDSASPTMHCSGPLFANYYYAQILIHREFLTPTRSRLLPFPSLAICCNAARSCAHVIDNIRSRGRILETFFWAPLLSGVSALILVITLLAQGPAGAIITTSAVADIRKCFRIAQDLRSHSFMADKVTRIFTRIVGRVDRAPGMSSIKLGEQLGMDPSATSREAPLPSAGSTTTPPSTVSLNLPFSTEDLSRRTFNGDPTFSPFRPEIANYELGGEQAFGVPSLDTSGGMDLWDAYQHFDWPSAAQEIAMETTDIHGGWFQQQTGS